MGQSNSNQPNIISANSEHLAYLPRHQQQQYIIESRPPPIYHQLSNQQQIHNLQLRNDLVNNNNNNNDHGSTTEANSKANNTIRPRNSANESASSANDAARNEWPVQDGAPGNVPAHLQLGNDGKKKFKLIFTQMVKAFLN